MATVYMHTFMKTDNIYTKRQVYTISNILIAQNKCANGKKWKNEVSRYMLNTLEEAYLMQSQILDDTYKTGNVKRFKVYYPKEREIIASRFRDRVRERVIKDNVLYPILTKSFLPTNFACQKGKGVDKGRKYLESVLKKYAVNYKNNFYVCKLDISGYFKNIDHDIIYDLFKKKLPEWAYLDSVEILEKQCDGMKVGYSPGNDMTQMVGITYLDQIDHFIKETLHVKHYCRYMDDFILVHTDKDFLEYCMEEIRIELNKIKLELHPKKSKIYNMRREQVLFLGFKYKVTNTGKVIMNINKKNVKHYKKKIRRLVNKAKRGEMPKTKVDACYSSWKSNAEKGRHEKLFKIMDKFYLDLWRDKNVDTQEIKHFDRSTKQIRK